jgi:glycosyltransferase involved in cell wall biosynthesis
MEPSVLFVGSLTGRKRGAFLLDGFLNEIRPHHPGATLTIVGADGPTYPGVVYLTGVADAQLAELYRRSWVYASPSAYEGFGLPYLEAMACGTPVVATPNPGSLELLGNGTYGLMPSDAEFMTIVSDLLGDEPRRQVLAAAGLQRAGEYSLSRMLDGYEQVLDELAHVHADPVASV